MTKAFIIRFHYKLDDPRFEWRFDYFKEKVLPRILAQTVQDFDIAIRCNPAHADLFRSLSPKIRPFFVKNEQARYKTGREGQRYFLDFVPWSDVIDLPKYELQLGLDSDDLIEPKYLEMVDFLIKSYSSSVGKMPLHISFQPELLDVKTGKIHRIKQRYSSKKGSAFFALYQPGEKYLFAYEESHLSIGRHFPESIVVASGYCFASCHNLNESTHI